MFHLELTTPVPLASNGKDVHLAGIAADGNYYHCKADSEDKPVRANEEVFTRLAYHVGIPTAHHNIITLNGETYFGSLNNPSTADRELVQAYFRIPAVNEIGAPDPQKAILIANLFAYDMFIANPDRGACNVLAIREGGYSKINAIDFADAALLSNPASGFPSASTKTIRWQRLLDITHSFAHEAALETLSRIDAVPVSFFEQIFDRMPADWLGAAQRLDFLEFWRGNERRDRVAALGAGLKDGSLR